MTGTIKQIASAINQLGGGVNFSSGAKVWKNGRKMSQPRMTVRNSRRNPPKLQGGSVIINRTNMLNPEVMTFEGTAYEIASQINSYGGNGVTLMKEGGKTEQKPRYQAEVDFYLNAENDEQAEKLANQVASKIGDQHQPKLQHLYYTPFASMFTRKLFKEGGYIGTKKLSVKQMALIVEKAVKRQKEYADLNKRKDKIPVRISTMIKDPHKQQSLLPKQRQELVDWALDDKNDVRFIVAFSGGKDSVAMVLKLLFDYNIPAEKIELWHHEVDGFGENLWDWKCTPSYCEAFAEAFGLKLLYSYREGGITGEILKGKDQLEISGDIMFQTEPNGEFVRHKSSGTPNRRMMFPAIVTDLRTRWCSSLVKIDVMTRAIKNTPELSKSGQVIICTGERRHEGGNRATYLEIEPYNFGYDKEMITWRPVIDMTTEEIWEMYEFYGIQAHPSYELGWGRCSCQTCIFNQAPFWATTNEISPEKIDRIAELEEITGTTLFNEKKADGSLKTIRDKVAEGRSVLKPEAKKRWQKEATGKFVSPIFVEGEWRLPDGAFEGGNCGAT
jgi:3'-phosphoadenosine 5'-phosphosulfate sulfotransferase (PAPS reductase)/FAD synthetase